MGLFSKKASLHRETLQALRPDLDQAISGAPPKVSAALLRQTDVLNYLNERLPSDESVQRAAKCSSSMEEYRAGRNRYGCLLLTSARLVCATADADTHEVSVLAWRFPDIVSLAFAPISVRGVPGCEASITYGANQQLDLMVDEDTNFAMAFLAEVQARLNRGGKYGL